MAVFFVNQCTFAKLPNSDQLSTNSSNASQSGFADNSNVMSEQCGLKFDSLYELIHHIEDNHIVDADYAHVPMHPGTQVVHQNNGIYAPNGIAQSSQIQYYYQNRQHTMQAGQQVIPTCLPISCILRIFSDTANKPPRSVPLYQPIQQQQQQPQLMMQHQMQMTPQMIPQSQPQTPQPQVKYEQDPQQPMNVIWQMNQMPPSDPMQQAQAQQQHSAQMQPQLQAQLQRPQLQQQLQSQPHLQTIPQQTSLQPPPPPQQQQQQPQQQPQPDQMQPQAQAQSQSQTIQATAQTPQPHPILKCQNCRKSYKTLHGLRTHMSTRHPEVVQAQATTPTPSSQASTPTPTPPISQSQTPIQVQGQAQVRTPSQNQIL